MGGLFCFSMKVPKVELEDILAEYEQSVPGKLYVREVVPLPEVKEVPKHTPKKVRDVRGWARSTITRWSREKK